MSHQPAPVAGAGAALNVLLLNSLDQSEAGVGALDQSEAGVGAHHQLSAVSGNPDYWVGMKYIVIIIMLPQSPLANQRPLSSHVIPVSQSEASIATISISLAAHFLASGSSLPSYLLRAYPLATHAICRICCLDKYLLFTVKRRINWVCAVQLSADCHKNNQMFQGIWDHLFPGRQYLCMCHCSGYITECSKHCSYFT